MLNFKFRECFRHLSQILIIYGHLAHAVKIYLKHALQSIRLLTQVQWLALMTTTVIETSG